MSLRFCRWSKILRTATLNALNSVVLESLYGWHRGSLAYALIAAACVSTDRCGTFFLLQCLRWWTLSLTDLFFAMHQQPGHVAKEWDLRIKNQHLRKTDIIWYYQHVLIIKSFFSLESKFSNMIQHLSAVAWWKLFPWKNRPEFAMPVEAAWPTAGDLFYRSS